MWRLKEAGKAQELLALCMGREDRTQGGFEGHCEQKYTASIFING